MDVFYRIIFHLIHLEEREEGESRNFNQIFFINQKYVIRYFLSKLTKEHTVQPGWRTQG